MKSWDEVKDEVRKIKPNKEIARSLLKMAKVRLTEVKEKNVDKFASLIVEDYYEIIKECIVALMSIDGLKTLSHKVLIIYLKKFYPQFREDEVILIDMLRSLRNKIVYYGFFIEPDFIKRNEKRILKIIEKLMKLVRNKLEE